MASKQLSRFHREMDSRPTVVCTSNRNTVRTDLSLLLECLKFQMKSPDLQKQALLTIHSICEKREDNVDLLREMGGVAFVYNLSKSSIVRSDVKETALFTLGTLAEANVYCKNSLCRKETFADLASLLVEEDIPLTQKRVSVYLLSVLVANNKSGQTLSQTTSCLDILLDLFRTTSPLSAGASLRAADATQTFQLWASVSSALCGCVNNPQNGIVICVFVFRTEQGGSAYLCSSLSCNKSVASADCAATHRDFSTHMFFHSNDGCQQLRSGYLTLALARLASAADTSLLSCQLSVTISKTLSACITENCLAQYGVVSHLFSLLASPHLDHEERLSVLLTMGHCTEASYNLSIYLIHVCFTTLCFFLTIEEHQFQLVQCGGLPLIITLLTEDTSEEVRKAATFILQTCKQATMSMGVPGVKVRQCERENVDPFINMESFKSSARELLSRIDQLEKRPAKQESFRTIPTAYTLKLLEGGDDDNNVKIQLLRNVIKNRNNSQLKNMSSSLSKQEEKSRTSGGDVKCSVCKGTGALTSSHGRPLEGGREPHPADKELFKPPAPVRHSVPKERKCADEEELQDHEMSKGGGIQVEGRSLSHIRCAGCVLPFEEVTSRNFASLQSSCQQSCEMHRVLQEATERFRMRHCNLLFRREPQGDSVGQTDPEPDLVSAAESQRSWKNWNQAKKSTVPQHHWKRHNGITLTPLRRGANKKIMTFNNRMASHHSSPQVQPSFPSKGLIFLERRGGKNIGNHSLDDDLRPSTEHSPARRQRRDFSSEEVRYLLCGVKTYGFSWNSILWSYPFQPGRTNVDLAKKYRRLM
ncbi:hypothetical protein F7725_022778, partial [Dissostichus mawsoni]